ncbi:MAG: hypothetical protein AB1758_23220, partial [Candidatus Eremiobacterota bacterium]
MSSTGPARPAETNYVELISFLFLLGVTLGVMWPGYSTVAANQKNLSNLETCRKNLLTISVAMEQYQKSNKGNYPKYLSDLTGGKKPLLERLPQCPSAERQTYGL